MSVPYYIINTPLRHVTSAVLIPEPAASDILSYPEKGQERYEWLVENRILEGSPESIWDPLPQIKIKRFANWMPKTTLKVNNKIYKVRHNRQFQSKCLLVAKSRPELLAKLDYLMGKYEMSVFPCSLFTSDGRLIIGKDKAKLMTQIIQKKPQKKIDNKIEEKKKVIIIDAMCEVRALKKYHDTTKMIHLKELFIQRIKIKIEPYPEAHLLFDTYHELSDFSLKDGARDDRAQNALGTTTTGDYEIHDEMSIKKTSLNELFSSTPTKRRLTKYLAIGVLDEYENDPHHAVIASYGPTIAINKPHVLPDTFMSHSHEEADTQIPLHILFSIEYNALTHLALHFDVHSVDSDVLCLLLDLVSHYAEPIKPSTSIILHTGRGKQKKPVDIKERMECIGVKKCQGLLGFADFYGMDWGGKFVGITKDRWTKIYLELPADDPVIESFARLGSFPSSHFKLFGENLHDDLKPFEAFTCRPYIKDADDPYTLPELRWKHYSTKNCESENLPPTRGALVPELQRINHMCYVHRSYNVTHPNPPPVTESGWQRNEDGTITPVYCLIPPAPKDCLDLVECGCTTGCNKEKWCKCYRNGKRCSSLCKCTDCTNKTTESSTTDT